MAGKAPMLPLWLSPTQVRLIPISDKFLDKMEELAKQISSHCIRVDIDDSASTLQKKIREAEQEWIPYIIVVGEKEIESGKLSVRVRELKGQQQNMTTEAVDCEGVRENRWQTLQAPAVADCTCRSVHSSTVNKS